MFNEKGGDMVPSHSAKRRMKDVSLDTGLENDEKRLSNKGNTGDESLQSSMGSIQLQPSKEVDDSSILETSFGRSKNQSSVLDVVDSMPSADQLSVLDISNICVSSKRADQSSVLELDSASNSSNGILDELSNTNNAKEQDSSQEEDDINIFAMSAMMNQSSLNDEEYSSSLLNKQENSDDESKIYDVSIHNRNTNGSCLSLDDVSQIMNPDEICSKLQDICNEIKNEKISTDEAFVDLYRFLDENAPFDSTDDLQVMKVIGKEVVEILKKEKSLKKNMHLLAFLRGHIRLEDASRLLQTRFISNDIWSEAMKHRLLVGAGKVDCEEKQIRHRRHAEEKTIQDFVEWLNAADLLQNLAYGEKIVRINGFHVAIESVKRTTSIQNIIRKYYWQFLDGSEKDGAKNKDENNDYGDDANDSDDTSDSILLPVDRGYESTDEEGDDERSTCKLQCLYDFFKREFMQIFGPLFKTKRKTLKRTLLYHVYYQ